MLATTVSEIGYAGGGGVSGCGSRYPAAMSQERRRPAGGARLEIRRWRESKATRQARGAEIVRRLHAEYPKASAELAYANPFQFLVAVILSAQTTDVNVNRATPGLFQRYPTPAALAEASQEDVEELIRTTGFFRNKAKSIRSMAARLLEDFEGRVPLTMEALLTLPGVARKTANVVLGEAFGVADGIVVDTHVTRLAQRLGLSRNTDPVKIERDLMELLDRDEWIFVGHSVIWHGRRVCDARRPDCDGCALNDICPSSAAPVRPARSPFGSLGSRQS